MTYSTVILDIEGTTTPVDFVYKVLFPYARDHMTSFLDKHAYDGLLAKGLEMLAAEHETGAPEKPADHLLWLMDQDRKSPALKEIQGLIWKEGYEQGELHGEVYADVPPALQGWKAQGKKVAIYSSGSMLAQELLFGSVQPASLLPFIDAHFDTGVGAKNDPTSYAKICAELGQDPAAALFLSDMLPEIEAAKKAGLQAVQVFRDGKPAGAEGITNFSELR